MGVCMCVGAFLRLYFERGRLVLTDFAVNGSILLTLSKRIESMITTSFVYNRKNKATGSVPCAVEIRITENRKSWYISTGVKVLKGEWLEGSVVNRTDANMLNRRLATMIGVVGRELDACIIEQRPVDVEVVKHKLNQQVVCEGEKIVEWFWQHIPLLKLSTGTKKRYNTLLNRLSEYDGLRTWGDVTVEGIYNFDAWLHQRKKVPSGVCAGKAGDGDVLISDSAVYNYHKCLKALLRRAVRLGKIESSPYDSMQGEFSKGDNENTEYLTADEMAAFESLKPVWGSEMAKAHDLFTWQLHTGMSYGDTQAFDFAKYKKVNGKWVYVGPRIKTGVAYITMLDDVCESILARYDNRLPRLSNQQYNNCLKLLGMAAGISTPLHSHLARHSFATKMLSNDVPIQNVSKMLGHKRVAQTERYAKVLAQSVFDDFTRVFDSHKMQGQ